MRGWHMLTTRLRSLLLRGRRERELHDELRDHIERETGRRIAQGLDPGAARRLALREFGAVERVKDECRDARGTMALEHLARDARHALRRLIHDWRFSAAAIVILALGIGANTAIFSAVNATLLRTRPVADPERLVNVYQNAADGTPGTNSYPAYLDMAAYSDVFAAITAVSVPGGVSYVHGGAIRTGAAEYTTASYPRVLGIRPALGRWFDETEDRAGAEVVAVLGHQAWTTRFGSDPSVVGRTIRMQGIPVTIVGVGPAGYRSTFDIGLVTEFWLPVQAVPALGGPPRSLDRRPFEAMFFVKARLRDGASVAQARAAMDVLGTRLAREFPDEDPGRGISVLPSTEVRVHPQFDPLLAVVASLLLGAVGLVLAVACSNLATLLLVRAAARAKEISVRLAVGATRWRLVSHLLAESLLLALAGGALGSLLSWWLIRALRAVELPISVDLTLDYRVLLFAIGLSLVTGLLFGLTPALRATRVDPLATLREDGVSTTISRRRGGPSGPRVMNALVMFQVAVSVLLVAAAAVFLQMVMAARAQGAGFAVEGVAMIETDVRYAGYSGARAADAYEQLRRRVAALPGVETAVLTRGAPMSAAGLPLVIERGPAGNRAVVGAGRIWAGPGFLEALRIPILFGRAIDERDRAGTPLVAVVSETMARQYFGEVNAVGRRFRVETTEPWIEIVGVVRDTGTSDRQGDLVDPVPQLFFQSFEQVNLPPTTVLARTSLDAAALVAAMQRELLAMDPGLPVIAAQTLAQHLERSLTASRAIIGFLGALGAVGLTLAAVGLYAVIAFAVARREREIGIRMALGARSRDVAWGVARDATRVLGVGAGAGTALAALLILAMRAFATPAPGIEIYRPHVDPLLLGAIAASVVLVGVAAAIAPARRAATVDPLTAMRHS